jgi:hypothetical protein
VLEWEPISLPCRRRQESGVSAGFGDERAQIAGALRHQDADRGATREVIAAILGRAAEHDKFGLKAQLSCLRVGASASSRLRINPYLASCLELLLLATRAYRQARLFMSTRFRVTSDDWMTQGDSTYRSVSTLRFGVFYENRYS